VVIYDPELTLTLPPRVARPSGHERLCAEGIRALARSLPVIMRELENLAARSSGP